ncbi:MAG TPA: hypothetical protein VG477_14635, partial [Thermoanaerobaculia bacterium]|nr:hypothetical protein [Thermoanaerobaculia bacterium]
VTIYYHDPAAPTRTYMVIAGAKKKGKQCGNRVFRIRRFVPPARDLYVVNSTKPDGYLDCSRAAVPAAQNVANWKALKTAIDNRFAALKRPITVFAISHGDISEQSVAPAFTLFNNNPNVQAMTAAPPAGVKGRVSRYDAFSCCTGRTSTIPPTAARTCSTPWPTASPSWACGPALRAMTR